MWDWGHMLVNCNLKRNIFARWLLPSHSIHTHIYIYIYIFFFFGGGGGGGGGEGVGGGESQSLYTYPYFGGESQSLYTTRILGGGGGGGGGGTVTVHIPIFWRGVTVTLYYPYFGGESQSLSILPVFQTKISYLLGLWIFSFEILKLISQVKSPTLPPSLIV